MQLECRTSAWRHHGTRSLANRLRQERNLRRPVRCPSPFVAGWQSGDSNQFDCRGVRHLQGRRSMVRVSSKFQQQAMGALCRVPPGVNCPCCHHQFDIVVSRKQVLSGYLARRLFRYYRCGVCDHRFSTFNHKLISWSWRLALPTVAFGAITFLSTHL
jgi:hypothetical protein